MFENFELTKKTGCREIPRFYFCIMGSFQYVQVPCQSGENRQEILRNFSTFNLPFFGRFKRLSCVRDMLPIRLHSS